MGFATSMGFGWVKGLGFRWFRVGINPYYIHDGFCYIHAVFIIGRKRVGVGARRRVEQSGMLPGRDSMRCLVSGCRPDQLTMPTAEAAARAHLFAVAQYSVLDRGG
eukprot:358363-Chlamydomonas_euryale.AAC.3